jgi:hypothetical protein
MVFSYIFHFLKQFSGDFYPNGPSQLFINGSSASLTHSLTHSLARSFTRPRMLVLLHSFFLLHSTPQHLNTPHPTSPQHPTPHLTLTLSHTHSLTYSLTYSLTHSHTHSLTHTHSLPHPHPIITMGCSNSKPKKEKKPVVNPYAKIHRQMRKEELEEAEKAKQARPLQLQDVMVPPVLQVSPDDFEMGSYLQEGGMGKGGICVSE